MEKCKKMVHTGPQRLINYRCNREATKDGFCWQHHPDAVKKREAHRAKVLELTPYTMFTRH
jgi:hypothetical protein